MAECLGDCIPITSSEFKVKGELFANITPHWNGLIGNTFTFFNAWFKLEQGEKSNWL